MTVVPAGMLACAYRETPIQEALIPAPVGEIRGNRCAKLLPTNNTNVSLLILRGNSGQVNKQEKPWQSKESIAVIEDLLVLSNNIVTLRETVEI